MNNEKETYHRPSALERNVKRKPKPVKSQKFMLNKEVYYDLFNKAADAIYLLDEDGCFIDVNKGAEEMYGYKREEFFGKTPEFVSAPGKNDLEEVTKQMQQALNGRPQQLEFWGKRKNGEFFPKLVRLQGDTYSGKKVLIAIGTDISVRKEAEDRLKIRLNYERIISEISSFAIKISNINEFKNESLSVIGKTLNISRVYIFKHNLSSNTYDNTHEWTCEGIDPQIENLKDIPDDSAPWWHKQLKSNKVICYSDIDDLPHETERNMLRIQDIKSILVVPFFVSETYYGFIGIDECFYKRPWPKEDVDLIMSASRIISATIEHHFAVTALRENELKQQSLYNLLRTVSDNMTDMLWAKDIDKKYLFANKAICKNLLNARSTEEPIGKTDLFFANRERESHSGDADWHTFGEICRDSDQVIIDTNLPAQFDEFGNVKGKFLFLDVYKSPLVDEMGSMIGIVGSARDVTHEKEIK